MKDKIEYKLVILGNNWDLYKIAYSDILTNETLYLDSYIPQNLLLKVLFKLHFWSKINNYIKLPFKGIWKYYYFRKLDKKQPTVFLYFRNWFEFDCQVGLVNYINKKFNKSKNILFFQDIISSFNIYGKPINIENVKSKFDLVLSYDHGDCNKYGLTYHPTVFSKYQICPSQYLSEIEYYDVLFIGKDKGRLNLLIQISKKLNVLGLKYKFIILGKKPKNIEDLSNIEFIRKMMKYPQILELVAKSKCLLELIQEGSIGQTYRTLESIAYNKLLLTNNLSIKNSDIYDPSYIHIISSSDDISEDLSAKIKNFNCINNKFVNSISPRRLIEFIEKKLGIQISL